MSFQCKAKTGDKQKPTSKIPNTYINKVNKKAATPYLVKKKKNGKVIAIKANKGKGTKRIWVLKKIISTMKSTKKVWIPRGKSEESEGLRGIWRLGIFGMYIMGYIILDHVYCQVGLCIFWTQISPPMTKVTIFIIFLVFRYVYLFSCI
jgi:hypothetical protein